MHLTRYHDPHEFYARAETFLIAHEAEHCLILGLTNVLRYRPERYPEFYLSLVEDEGRIVAAALRTPPHSLAVSMIDSLILDEPIALLVQDINALYPDLPGIGAPATVSKAFVERWKSRTGQHYVLEVEERIYKLEAVNPVHGVPGSLRPASQMDRDILIQWMFDFEAEAFPNATPTLDNSASMVDFRLNAEPSMGAFYLWDDETGKAVSFAGYTGPTPHGIRVGPVYTPPEFRKKGYASACVAGLSQHLLDGGRDFCFLFTDLANPTSNKIYQDIGYVPVVDYDVYKLVSNP